MNPTAVTLMLAFALFVSMPFVFELGRRLAIRRLVRDPEGTRTGLGVVEGAVFSMLGLLIAFTFSGAANRFDDRRHLVVEEANDIGTAYLRIDLLPEGAQPHMRELFRHYLDSRIETYKVLPDLKAAGEARDRSLKLQGEIWTAAVPASHEAGPQAQMLFLPAVNDMIDIVSTRLEMTKIHPPTIIFVMLGLLTLASCLLAGYSMCAGKSRSWTHILVFSAAMSLTVYVIMDVEYPRFGFIRIDASDSVMQDLRASMK